MPKLPIADDDDDDDEVIMVLSMYIGGKIVIGISIRRK